MNLIVVDGNLVNDVEERRTKNDKVFYTFRLASTNRRSNTNYYNVCVLGATGEACAKHLHKGSKVVIRGELSIRTSGKDGSSYTYLDLDAENVIFCNTANNTKDETVQQVKPPKMTDLSPATDEDIPF